MENIINNKVFLITGAATGIGAGVTKALLDKGAKHVAILDIGINQGKALEAELNAKHGANKAKFIKCDVTTSDLDAAFEETLKNFKYIDVVINNAGIMNDSVQLYKKEIEINVTALITSSVKAFDLMRKTNNGRGGTIVNISSIVSLFQSPSLPIYSATKSAVLLFSNCLGHTANYSRTGVRVIAICFGQTDTSLLSYNSIGCLDGESVEVLKIGMTRLSLQSVDSAANGLVEAFENGSSGSTWLVEGDKPARDITDRINKTNEILSEGLIPKNILSLQ